MRSLLAVSALAGKCCAGSPVMPQARIFAAAAAAAAAPHRLPSSQFGGASQCGLRSSECPSSQARTLKTSSSVGVNERPSRALPMGVVDIPELDNAQIAICPCPGTRERELKTDLDRLVNWGAEAVVTLIQEREMEHLGVGDLRGEIEKRTMQWFHCPIEDFRPPGSEFESRWGGPDGAGVRVGEILRRGGKIAVHCRGGLGRAGTIASRLLVELGVCHPEAALLRVRKSRPGAVETAEQERHVLSRTLNSIVSQSV